MDSNNKEPISDKKKWQNIVTTVVGGLLLLFAIVSYALEYVDPQMALVVAGFGAGLLGVKRLNGFSDLKHKKEEEKPS
jgi:hypothetical protein